MDFVVRLNYSTELKEKVEAKAHSRQELSEIRDRFYKPQEKDLTDFSPRDVIVRKRTFPDRETLVKINIIQKPVGYTDIKQKLDNLKNYEKWGEFNSYAVEYKISIGEEKITVLKETFNFGKYIKIESPSAETLDKILQELDLNKNQLIEKNSAELLAEKINKI